jgi:hypothetical protein
MFCVGCVVYPTSLSKQMAKVLQVTGTVFSISVVLYFYTKVDASL